MISLHWVDKVLKKIKIYSFFSILFSLFFFTQIETKGQGSLLFPASKSMVQELFHLSRKLLFWVNAEMSHLKKSWDFCNAFFYHMETGMPKQLKQASFILVLYRIHSKPKPSSFAIILLYCFDSYCSFASGLQKHAHPSLGVQNILRFWVLEIFHLQMKKIDSYPQVAFSEVSNVFF